MQCSVVASQEYGFATFSLEVPGTIHRASRGLQQDSKILINSCLVIRLEANAAAMAGIEVCRNSPPKIACGVATADSSPLGSRRPVDPPYRSICCSWISRTSSSDRNTGSSKELIRPVYGRLAHNACVPAPELPRTSSGVLLVLQGRRSVVSRRY